MVNGMDYTARIQELSNLKHSITGKVISTGEINGFSSDVSGWEGAAPGGYSSLVAETKEKAQDIYETKEEVVIKIDARIAELETLIEDQYATHNYIPNLDLDDDPRTNSRKQRSRVYQISNLDSSVRNRLLRRI